MIVGWHRFVGCTGVALGLLFNNPGEMVLEAKTSQSSKIPFAAETVLKNLEDGAYQLCTEPAPDNWLDGAGVCLIFQKQETMIDGYYGYPHSNSYVCLRGQVTGDWFEGTGLVLIWSGERPVEPPQAELNWGRKDRLYLNQGEVVDQEGFNQERFSWVMFQEARLNMKGMYLYDRPRMTPANQLCDWNLD